MLKTCLKHDLRAYRRYFFILSFLMAIATLVGALLLRFCLEVLFSPNKEDLSESVTTLLSLSVLPMVFCIGMLFVSLLVSTFMTLWRMYSHFFTDQGYLTFTLPVNRSTLYLSKVISAIAIRAVTFLELVAGLLVICLIAPPTGGSGLINPIVFRELGNLVHLCWEGLGAWLIVWVLLGLLVLVATTVVSSGLYHLALTIGTVVAKKHKILAGIGIYFAVNMVFSLASQLFSLFCVAGILTAVARSIETGLHGPVISILMLISLCVCAVVAICFHLTTLGQIERRLNLA